MSGVQGSKALTVVVGAAGTVGRETMSALASNGPVRGVVRRPSIDTHVPSATYVMVDHESTDDMARAMMDAQSLVIVMGTSPQLVAIEKVAIDAALRAGVSRIVKISAPIVPNVEVSRWHQESEDYLSKTGCDYTIIRPTAFMQNWLRNAKPIKFTGRIFGSSGFGARNYVDVRDVATIAAQAAQQPKSKKQLEHILDVAGPEALSHQEVANRLSSILGKKISFVDMPPEEYRKTLNKKARLAPWLIDHLVELDTLAKAHPEKGSGSIKRLTGRSPRIFDEFIYEHRSSFERPTFWSI